MTSVVTYSMAFLAIYIFFVAILAWSSSKGETSSGYLIGDRNVGLLPTLASLASGFRDGAGLAAWVTLAVYFGFGALWLTVGMVIGLVVLGFLASGLRNLAAEQGFLTVGDLISHRIGIKTARTASLLIALTALLYAAAQLFVGGRVLASLMGVSSTNGVIASGLIVGAYLWLGGYKSVIRTDLLQWLVIMAVIGLPFALMGQYPKDLSPMPFFEIDSSTALGFTGISFLVVASSADVWQRIFSSASGTTARNALWLTAPVYLIISVAVVILGLTIASVAVDSNPSEALFDVFSVPSTSPVAVALLGVFIVAAVMSTLDTQIFLFASTFVREIARIQNEEEEAELAKGYRLTMAGTIIILGFVAVSIGDIVEFLFGAVTLGTVVLPVLFIAALSNSRETDGRLALSLLIGAVVYVWLFSSGAFENLVYTLVPSAVATVLCVAVVLFSPKTAE